MPRKNGDSEHEIIGRAIDDGDEFLYQKCCQLYRSYERLIDKMQALKYAYKTFNNSTPEEIRSVTKTRIIVGPDGTDACRDADAESLLEDLNSDGARETYLRKVDMLLTAWDKHCDSVLRQIIDYVNKHNLFSDHLYESTDGEVTEVLLTHGEVAVKSSEKKKRAKKKKVKK